MNNARRKELDRALALIDQAEALLSEAFDIAQAVRDEEQEAYDNLPESFQDGERGQVMMGAVDALDEVTFEDALTDGRDAIERAKWG